MADPVSAIGLALQVGELIKNLYDYGNGVKNAQKDIIGICGELTALKSILEMYCRYGSNETTSAPEEFQKMLLATRQTLLELAKMATPKASGPGRALQSLALPFSSSIMRDRLVKLERMKTWFLMATVMSSKVTADKIYDEMVRLTELLNLAQLQRDNAHREQDWEEYRGLLGLIAPASPDAAHSRACQYWQSTTTGSWFCKGELKAWMENSDEEQYRTLVLSGRSGSGKTILMSRAIEKLKMYAENQSHIRMAYFYCAYNDRASRQTRNILGSWVAQITTDKRGVLDRFRNHANRVEDISIDQLEEVILELAAQDSILFVLDAINESADGHILAGSIARLIASSSNIKCLIATTPYYRPVHEGLGRSVNHVSMSMEAVNLDIATYIRDQASRHRILGRIPVNEIIDAILPKCGGMFRWVDCQMPILTNQLTPNGVRRALRELPGTLDSTYEAMLRRVPRGHIDLVREVLIWLSFCQRPLLLDELCEAVIIQEDQVTIDEGDSMDEPEELLAMCQGLAEIDPRTGTVALAHESVKSFLVGEYIRSSEVAYFALSETECSRSIARKCVVYLLMDPFTGGYNSGTKMEHFLYIVTMLVHYRLLDYATNHWALHSRACQLTEVEVKLIRRFFETQRRPFGGNFAFWICCLLPEYPVGPVHESEPLYYAASFGLTQIVRLLLQTGLVSTTPSSAEWHIDQKGGRNDSTPLGVACYRGHTDVVDLLLTAGADPEGSDASGLTGIFWADMKEYTDIVRRLEQAGATRNGWRFHADEDGQGIAFTTDGSNKKLRWRAERGRGLVSIGKY